MVIRRKLRVLSAAMDSSLYKSISSGDIDQLKQVISSDNDLLLLHQMTPLNNTTLHVAVIYNKIECVQEICNQCPSLLTKPNKKGDLPLHIAARLGLSDIASFLINQAKINQEDIENIGEGNHDVVETIPEQLQLLLRMRNNRNDTALHDAVRNHRFEVVKLLTEADPTFEYLECNDAGETPLYLAAEDGLHDCVVQILQTCPSSAHAGPLGRTALHAAVKSKKSDVTKILLDKKPDIIKEEDEYGYTALHYATFFGMAVMVAQFLDIDSSVAYMSNKDGKTALHIAAIIRNHSTDMIEELTRRCPDCWELLDNKGQNFLHFAAEIGKYEVIEYVLRQPNMMVEYLINQQDNDGNTPLHLASMSDVVEILCTDKRVSQTIVNKDKFTALEPVYNDLQVNGPYSASAAQALDYMKQAGASNSWRFNIIQGQEDQARMKHQYNTNTNSNANTNTNTNTNTNPELEEVVEKRRETDLLVATLIATVTFAAGFTLPGGYNSDGSHKGMATLANRPAFIVFVISNSVAMLLSTFTVFINFWPYPTGRKSLRRQQMHRFCAVLGYTCTYMAIIGMVIAFVTGTYSVLLHSPRLAIPTIILGCSFFILCVIFFYGVYKLVGINIIGLYIPPPKK